MSTDSSDSEPDISANKSIEYEVSHDIYNATLIAIYIRPNKFTFGTKCALLFSAWLSYCTQWICLISLSFFIIFTGNTSHVFQWVPPVNWINFVAIIPFIYVAVLLSAKEYMDVEIDTTMLRDNVRHQDLLPKPFKKIHEWLLKWLLFTLIYGPRLLILIGSAGYLLIFLTFSDSNGSYDDYFNYILNVLAYAFVFEIDDWAFQYFTPYMKWNHILKGKDDNYFSVDHRQKSKIDQTLYVKLWILILLFSAYLMVYFLIPRIMYLVGSVMIILLTLWQIYKVFIKYGLWRHKPDSLDLAYLGACNWMVMGWLILGFVLFFDNLNVRYGFIAAFVAYGIFGSICYLWVMKMSSADEN